MSVLAQSPAHPVFAGEVFADAARRVLPAPQGNIHQQRKRQDLYAQSFLPLILSPSLHQVGKVFK